MFLLVGLGNPGRDYAKNRHNAGFMVIEAIIDLYRLGPNRARFQAITNEGAIGGEKVLALRPQTYMNLSGQSVGEAMRFFKVPPERVIVFYDELDLLFGKIRVRKGGGTAGHNGVKSLVAHIGPEFWRVRLGIAHPGEKASVTGHVLGDFSAAEREVTARMFEASARHVGLLMAGDDAGYMNKVTNEVTPPRNKPKPAAPDEGAED